MTPTTPAPSARRDDQSPARRPAGDRLLLAVRVLVAAAAVALTAYAAFFVGFWAVVTYSGCLFDCTTPEPAGGVALAVAAAAVLACGPLAVAAVFRSRAWVRAAGGVFLVAAGLAVGALLVG